jgi:hypothetical protein
MPGLKNTSKIELSRLLDEADRRRARRDPIFFIDRYLMTFDPRPEAYPHDLDFHTYDFQQEIVMELLSGIENGSDLFIEKSRDMGATWTILAVFFWAWLFMPGFQALVGSRKEEYVDAAGDMKTLFQKIDYMIRRIKDPLLLPEGFNFKDHRTYMKLINPENGNAIIGESSNANFGRAGRFRVVLMDELAFWPDDKSAWQACSESTRCRVAITTPPDHPTWTKKHRFSGKLKVLTYHWRKHPAKDDAWYEYEKSRKTEEEVLHELDISWEYSGSGRPYPEISKVPFRQLQYESNMPLYISLDLGLDALALAYYQPVVNSDWVGVLDAFESSDHVIEWYFPFFGLYDCINAPECPWCGGQHNFDYNDTELAFVAKVMKFGPAIFFGDPSGKARHIESGISPYSILADHGIDVQVNDLENDWVPRRDAVKRLLPRMVMNDTPGVRWMHECIKDSHYPKREETSQSVTPISKPVHDWTSHHRTELEFFGVNYKGEYEYRRQLVQPNPPQDRYKQTPNYAGPGGSTMVEPVDIGKVLHETQQVGRDWRNS